VASWRQDNRGCDADHQGLPQREVTLMSGWKAILCMTLGGLLGGCGLLPADSSGTSAGSGREDAYRQAYDACTQRAAAEHGRTLTLLRDHPGAGDTEDPLSPHNMAASRAHVELTNCMRSKGWPGIGQ
jgi:hypothetical protein